MASPHGGVFTVVIATLRLGNSRRHHPSGRSAAYRRDARRATVGGGDVEERSARDYAVGEAPFLAHICQEHAQPLLPFHRRRRSIRHTMAATVRTHQLDQLWPLINTTPL